LCLDFNSINDKLNKSLFEIEELRSSKNIIKEIEKNINLKLKDNSKELRSNT